MEFKLGGGEERALQSWAYMDEWWWRLGYEITTSGSMCEFELIRLFSLSSIFYTMKNCTRKLFSDCTTRVCSALARWTQQMREICNPDARERYVRTSVSSLFVAHSNTIGCSFSLPVRTESSKLCRKRFLFLTPSFLVETRNLQINEEMSGSWNVFNVNN